MTVAIKGMDMPISTQKCQFFKRDSHFENGTQIVSEMICLVTGKKICNVDNILPLYSCKRCPDCPLIDLPEENKDMSWKELNKFAKDEIVFEYKSESLVYFEIDSPFFLMKFYKDGDIYFNDTKMLENKKPFEMWQIIKALVGER